MDRKKIRAFYNPGFTIVELLIVIVIVGILATISYIGFSGVVNKAEKSKVESTLSNCAKSLEMYHVQSDAYPLTDDYLSSLLQGCPKTIVGPAEYDYSSADGSSYRLTGTLADDGFIDVRVSSKSTPSSSAYVAQVLLVAGGGGGGSSFGGGGGGGGFTYISSYTLSAGSHSVVVGVGGAIDNIGGYSGLDSIIAPGGGAGGKYMASNTLNGGSGGGSSGNSIFGNNQNDGGSSTCPEGCIGYIGGQGGRKGGGGGGGAGGSGSDATGSVTIFKYRDTGGDGGPARQSLITGSAAYYASGGRGANASYVWQCSGIGGGGGAGYPGCSGIVIISYLSNWVTVTGGDGASIYTDSENLHPRTTGPYDGGHTIRRFYTTGTYQFVVTYL